MEIKKIHKLFLGSKGIATDTRKIEKDSIFFALKGENFNGNKFTQQAFENGAKFVVLDEKEFVCNQRCILVEDVLETLQNLSAYHRQQFKIPVIGITGTNGKTTTKELIKLLLSTQFNVFATKGNFNNHIGVPLSLLSITKETEIAIIEMGANHVNEIATYCKWVKPTLGLVTNIGKAHLEGFGSFENIIKAKSELYDELMNSKKIIFYNADDILLKDLLKDYVYKISYGSLDKVDSKVILTNIFPTVSIQFEEQEIRTNLFGEYNKNNIAAAISIASYFDIPLEFIKKALETYAPDNNRSEIKQIDDNIMILDAYNANPTSVLAVIESFSKLNVENKVLFLGDMFELGKDEQKLHQEIIYNLEQTSLENIILVGEIYSKCNSFKKYTFIKTTKEAKEWYDNQNFSEATILIKGSRGMKMETIIS